MTNKKHCLLFFSLSFLTALQTRQPIFSQLAQQRLQCFSQPEIIQIDPNDQKSENKKVDLTFAPLSEHTIHSQIFSLFGNTSVAPSSIADSNSWKDLELIIGDHDTLKNLGSFLDRTTTSFGSNYLLYEITHPHRTKKQLENRQKAIKLILNNQKLFLDIEEALRLIKSTEEIFFHIFRKEDAFNQKMIQSLYFTSTKPVLKYLKIFNSNTSIMECVTLPGRLFSYGIATWLYIQDFAIRHGINVYEEAKKNNVILETWKDYARLPFERHGIAVLGKSAQEFLKMQDPRVHTLKDITSLKELQKISGYPFYSLGDNFKLGNLMEAHTLDMAQKKEDEAKRLERFAASIEEGDWSSVDQYFRSFSAEDLSCMAKNHSSFAKRYRTSALWTRRIQHFVTLGRVAFKAYLIKYAYQRERDYNDLTNYLHTKVNSVALIVRNIKALSELTKNNPLLLKALEHHEDLHALFCADSLKTSSKLKNLCSLLLTNTFNGSPSYFSLKGRVLAAYSLLEDVKEEFAPALRALGEVDTLLSTAKLYQEYQAQEIGYTFPTYSDADTPMIQMVDMWNPFVGAEKSVRNSITLGNGAKKNIILTGPNAGGKSTFLKGLTLNILLAQTLGIAPARELIFTPFAKINTYMNITDDTAGGKSLFKSEVLRAQELIKTVTTLNENQFSLSIMDEMFSGTSPKEGAAASYAVAKNLGNQNNSILLLATHFPLLTKLEQDTQNFTNYQVRVVRHEDGTFSYPFKLETGIADQNVALDIIQQQGFESSILKDAQNVLNSEFNT